MRYIKNEQYHRLLSRYRWQEIRHAYLTKHPVCEMCDSKGKTSVAKVVHHIIPIEDASDVTVMESLAFDHNNLMALCESCHEQVHRDLCSAQKARKRTRRAEAKEIAERFVNKWCNPYGRGKGGL